MRMKHVGNKEDIVAVIIRNAEASAAINLGDPVCLNMNGTGDGFDAIRTTNSAAKTHGLLFGVACQTLAAGDYGDAQVFGFCRKMNLLRATRAASTDSWASQASIAALNALVAETVNGQFASAASAASNFLPYAVLGESLASYASSASATSDTRTAITAQVKGFVRML